MLDNPDTEMALLYATNGTIDPLAFVWIVAFLVAALFVYLLWAARASIWFWLYFSVMFPVNYLRRLRNRWITWRIRREHVMKRSREQKLKEEAASHLIAWLMERVHQGTLSLQDSYDLQKTLARTMAMPSLMPVYEPNFVKEAIKARRSMNGKAPVPFPDLNRRGRLKALLHSGK